MVVPIARGVDYPPLLTLLADGELHSGEWLAGRLDQSRAAVWKAVERMRALGIDIESVARRGYRLPHPVDLLDAGAILEQVEPQHSARLRNLELAFELDSTNTRLLRAPPPPLGIADVCSCEIQRAGRGRLGRRWVAPFGSGMALSIGWSFSDSARSLPALSLGVGIAVERALSRLGTRGIKLKWPNDIWFEDRKLGGILIEVHGEAGGPAHVVMGIGINIALTERARTEIRALGADAAAVAEACATPPSRNAITGAILDQLLSMLMQYERSGFAPLRDAWTALDALGGRPAQIKMGDDIVRGIARGVDTDGALLLEAPDQMHRFVSGEASLRLS